MTAPAGAHPTVPWGQPGQPGGPPAAPAAPAAPNGGPPINQPYVPPAPAAPAAPHQTVPFGPGGGAPAPAAPAPAGPASGVDPNQVIQPGSGVPPELVGRTVGQAFQIYSALATEWLRRTPQGGGTQAPPPAPGQPAPAQPGAAPGAPRPTAGAPPAGDFWRDPEGSIKRIVAESVAQQMAPVTQASQETEIIRARDIALAGIPDAQALWPEMVQALQGVDAAGLMNPQVWQRAADMARGTMMRAGTYRAPAPAAAPAAPSPASPNGPFTAAGGRPSIPAGSPGAAVLPQVAFFVEGPSTPQGGGAGGSLSAEEADVASKFGMSPQDYQAWKGGVSRGR